MYCPDNFYGRLVYLLNNHQSTWQSNNCFEVTLKLQRDNSKTVRNRSLKELKHRVQATRIKSCLKANGLYLIMFIDAMI